MKKLILILTMLFMSITFSQQDRSATNEDYMYWSGFLGSVFTGSPSITLGANGGNSGQINFIASDNDQLNLDNMGQGTGVGNVNTFLITARASGGSGGISHGA